MELNRNQAVWLARGVALGIMLRQLLRGRCRIKGQPRLVRRRLLPIALGTIVAMIPPSGSADATPCKHSHGVQVVLHAVACRADLLHCRDLNTRRPVFADMPARLVRYPSLAG